MKEPAIFAQPTRSESLESLGFLTIFIVILGLLAGVGLLRIGGFMRKPVTLILVCGTVVATTLTAFASQQALAPAKPSKHSNVQTTIKRKVEADTTSCVCCVPRKDDKPGDAATAETLKRAPC